MSFHLGCRDYAVGFMAAARLVALCCYDFASRVSRHGNNDLRSACTFEANQCPFCKIVSILSKSNVQYWREERKR